MYLFAVLDHAHHLVRGALRPGDVALDATVGNGHDTLVLAEGVGATGRVYGFDVQSAALAQARRRLQEVGLAERVTLFETGHERLRSVLPAEVQGQVRVVMFNLGYLPGSDKHVVTTPERTLPAMEAALDVMSAQGLMTVVLYWRHTGGTEEAEAVLAWAAGLDPSHFTAQHFQTLNRQGPPTLLVVERRQG